jgi:hypothetical protein
MSTADLANENLDLERKTAMKVDDRFPPLEELQMANLFPSANEWPELYLHQKALAAARNEGEALVRAAFAEIAEINATEDFTPEARRRKRGEVASEYIAKLQDSTARKRAEEEGEAALKRYQDKIEQPLKVQEDAHQIAVHGQIRDRLSKMKDETERMGFLEKNCDAATIRAVLTAPAWLSGLSEVGYSYVRMRLERQAPPEVLAERDFVRGALGVIERGYRAAKSRVAQRGDLVKAPDGSWYLPNSNSPAREKLDKRRAQTTGASSALPNE